jgi:AcrR family transcriptional regulator
LISILSHIKIQVNPKLYLKDPHTSELGEKILEKGIDLIDELGFEHFTFKKLALEIHSTEASIYRYFESKQKLMFYLINWYWSFIEYRLLFETANVQDSKERLSRAIHILTSLPDLDSEVVDLVEAPLKKIVMNESIKVIMTKEVDVENKEGVFAVYKSIVKRVAEIILEVNPKYPYPNMLVSAMIEGSNQQRFFELHLPGLTNQMPGSDFVEQFYKDLVFKVLENE